MRDDHSVVLFDGVCNFCNASVRWIIGRDRLERFRFAALQSGIGAKLQRRHGLHPNALDSLVLIEGDRIYLRSTAALRLVRRMPGVWPVLYALIAVPRPICDFAYDWFARHRYRWFGKRDECMVPSEKVKAKFLS